MEDPVVAADGYTYERANIERWLLDEGKESSPMTGLVLPHTHVNPSHTLKQQIREHLAARAARGGA